MTRKALCLALLLPLVVLAAKIGPTGVQRVANLGEGNQPVYSGNPNPHPKPLVVVGSIDTVGGTMFDIWFNGPMSTTIYCDPTYGLHATWMYSNGSPSTDRNMRYNFYDKTAGQWSYNQGTDFMLWGVNGFDVRTGFGMIDGHPSAGTAWISAHRSYSGGVEPYMAQDQSPGAGSFLYCEGQPNAAPFQWPSVGLTSSAIPNLVMMDAATSHLWYSNINPWCTWMVPISVPGTAPDALFPDYNIASSHMSTTAVGIWENMNANPATEQMTGWIRVTHDDGATFDDPVQIPFPPAFNTGDTTPTFDITSFFGMFDSKDSLHLVANLQPFLSGGVNWLPSQIWHYDFTNGWHLVHAAYTDTWTNPGTNAAYADRPTLCQIALHEYVCVWEQLDSVSVDTTTGENRWRVIGARSIDDGVTWGDPVVLATGDDATSLRYPCISRNTFGDDTCHMMYLEDLQAGFAVSNTPVGTMTPNPVIHQKFWKGMLPTAIAESRATSPSRMLLAVAPNPSHGMTRLSYALPQVGDVSLKVYDNMGRLVRTLARGKVNPGNYSATWNGLNDDGARLSDGVYFVTLSAGNAKVSQKLTLLQ